MTNPYRSAPKSARRLAIEAKEILNPKPDELKNKINNIKCDRGFDSGLCEFGKHKNSFTMRKRFDMFYEWLDSLTQAEYDDMSLTDKCEKFFF